MKWLQGEACQWFLMTNNFEELFKKRFFTKYLRFYFISNSFESCLKMLFVLRKLELKSRFKRFGKASKQIIYTKIFQLFLIKILQESAK